MKLFLAIIFVLNCMVLVSSQKKCKDVKAAIESMNECVSSSEESTPTIMHQKVTGVKKGSTFIEEDVLLQLQTLTGLSRRKIRACLKKLEPSCPQNTCGDSDTYSSIDGTCNNVANYDWGAANTAYLRDLAPVYADGVESPRKALGGSDLPEPRLVSNTLLSETQEQHSNVFTKWVPTFGQLLAHDFIKTPVATDENGNTIDCCDQPTYDKCASQCLPIAVPADDPYFSTVNQTCINFVRSVSVPCNLCKLATYGCKRDQMNVLSAYVDGSATYGENAEHLAELRDGVTAKLKSRDVVIKAIKRSYLPGDDSVDACRDGNKRKPCFMTGDSRANVEPSLQAALTLFMREHNRVVERLRAVTSWDEEKLFQESRKIVIAELQHFSFSHYMETVLGVDLAKQYGLKEKKGYDSVYDSSVNAGIANHFATAAFRFGHSLVTSTQGQNKRNKNKLLVTFPQSEVYFRVKESYRYQGIDGFVRFLQSNKMGEADSALPEAVQNQLFMDIVTRTSLDLGAINTERGRDHGMPGYNAWKEWCGQDPFPLYHTQSMADKILTVYTHANDIDLFVGGLSEEILPGAVVGPLFGCLIGRQMQRSKTGDRYYFQNPPDSSTTIGRFTEVVLTAHGKVLQDVNRQNTVSYNKGNCKRRNVIYVDLRDCKICMGDKRLKFRTRKLVRPIYRQEEQVRSIQKFTLARMVCENTDTQLVQKNIFKQVTNDNPEIKCGSQKANRKLPDIDFTLWSEANR